jgi:nicotinamidase-related amidase
MIYDLAHGKTALLVIDVQREYFDPTSRWTAMMVASGRR